MNTLEILQVPSPTRAEGFFRGKPPKLWGVGDPAILDYALLGIVSARHAHSDLVLKISELLKQLVSLKHVAFVSGWHSPLEEEALGVLLAQDAATVLCLAKSLDRFSPSSGVERRITDGKTLVLTHCSRKAKRITRNASLRRNELIVELTKALLVVSAPEGSATLSLAKSALRHRKVVITPEHPMNKELLASGALPATLENLQTALR